MMIRFTQFMAPAVAIAFLLQPGWGFGQQRGPGAEEIGPAPTEQQDRQERFRQRDYPERRQATQQQEQQQQQVLRGHLTGEVVRIEKVTSKATHAEHLLAVLQTRDGERVAVDLGPLSTVKEHDLGVLIGERITAFGRLIGTADQHVLVAEEFSVGEQQVQIAEQATGAREKARPVVFASVIGEIGRIEEVTLPSDERRIALASIETDDGASISANLGLADELEELNLREGDRVAVAGRLVTVGGKVVLDAHLVQTEREKMEISQAGRLSGIERRAAYRGGEEEAAEERDATTESPRDGGLGVHVAPSDNGLRVMHVASNSPAEMAGIQQGDMILSIGEHRVNSPAELTQRLEQVEEGQTVEIRLRRNGREERVHATLTGMSKALHPADRETETSPNRGQSRQDRAPRWR